MWDDVRRTYLFLSLCDTYKEYSFSLTLSGELRIHLQHGARNLDYMVLQVKERHLSWRMK